jgi:hypothetical protein
MIITKDVNILCNYPIELPEIIENDRFTVDNTEYLLIKNELKDEFAPYDYEIIENIDDDMDWE